MKKEESFKLWKKDNGEELRYKYNLDSKSIVIDLGGFKGDWAKRIHEQSNCNLYVFEPLKTFYDLIKTRFNNAANVNVFCAGVSNYNGSLEIDANNEGTSLHLKTTGNKEKINIINFIEFLNNHNIKNIDLIKINIEGEEYTILESLIESGKIEIFDNLQIQFHDFIKDYKVRYAKIKESLEKTHTPTYYYPFIWENWKRK